MVYPDKIFITGTGTSVGKTVVAAIMVAGLNAQYWKPVQSGLSGQTDTMVVRELTGSSEGHFFPETYRLSRALSPHASAKIDNISIELGKFCLPKITDGSRIIVEGAGGVMVPLNSEHYMLDLMKKINVPIVLVADSGLGTINHTLLSLNMLQKNDLNILGVVMNGPRNRSNRDAIEHYGGVKVIAEIERIADLKAVDLKGVFKDCFS